MGIPNNIYAYTAPVGSYPEYVSVNDVDGKVEVTVRSPGHALRGYEGETGAIALSKDQAVEMAKAVLEHLSPAAPAPGIITPTIGRIVWYRAKVLDNSHPKESPEQAAMVVRVHGDRMVNLIVFGHDGITVPMTSVPLVQAGDRAPFDYGYCEWMPFQKGQAAKTEQLYGALGRALDR